MRLRMKNFNILRVQWKIQFLERVHEKPIYKADCLKKNWYPNAHYEVKNNYYVQILKFSLWKSKNIFNDFLKDVV